MLRAFWRGVLRTAAVALVLGLTGTALAAAERPDGLLGSAPLVSAGAEESWLGGVFATRHRFRLAPASTLSLIERYQRPWENHTPEWRAFFWGRYGFESAPLLTLTWRLGESLEPSDLPVAFSRPCPRWKAPKPLTIARYSDETEYLALFDCDGAIAPDVLDRLSTLARAPDSPRPTLPLPELPLDSVPGEWAPGVKLLDPRLVWLLGEIQGAFPSRTIVIQSGYRPHAHTSFHQRGKALDLYVQGVPNEELFALCRTLRDVGCGYYPNNRFVHLDVRPYGSAKATWVDVSEPGTPSIYVDGWPGVLDPGLAWMGRGGRRGSADQG
ncbi:MAG TPA: D-Ala-D-Ala carboxypeptidase family metallohydrolase [Polyangiaceae bacterium]|jgi:hypothetical protein|nr:D-Ala-D-Ala carboxypeptidase family metallohydrolase [Polyangiaceae bacterium]